MERLAACSEDESARRDLVAISESIKRVDSNDSREILRLHATYLKIVCRMAANPLGELMICDHTVATPGETDSPINDTFTTL